MLDSKQLFDTTTLQCSPANTALSIGVRQTNVTNNSDLYACWIDFWLYLLVGYLILLIQDTDMPLFPPTHCNVLS